MAVLSDKRLQHLLRRKEGQELHATPNFALLANQFTIVIHKVVLGPGSLPISSQPLFVFRSHETLPRALQTKFYWLLHLLEGTGATVGPSVAKFAGGARVAKLGLPTVLLAVARCWRY